MKVLITGSLGLVGSTAAWFYLNKGFPVFGIDNDMRRHFFGESGSVAGNMIVHSAYQHFGCDISKSEHIFERVKPDVIIHAAAQPSHDWSATNPLLDFGINAYSTLMLLEFTRTHSPDSVFIYLSTNKVYGDWPNKLEFDELETRYEPSKIFYLENWNGYAAGIKETMPIDQGDCIHSPFGVSKLAGDLYVQEYARYFGLKTGIFRCGCVTGSRHAGAELHGFLSYMVRCKKEKKRYKVYGYKGKQVRDNIHARDLVTAIDSFVRNPRPGEVYNMGGGRHSNISVLEALKWLKMKNWEYVDEPRKGDHRWYISDVSKFKKDYPEWDYKYNLWAIMDDLMR